MGWLGAAKRPLTRSAAAAAAAWTALLALAATPANRAATEDAGAPLAPMDTRVSALPPGSAAARASSAGTRGGRPVPETIQSTIILIDRGSGGEFVFRLANGQAWAQKAPRFIAVEAGERVVIAPTRLGGDRILATERSAATRVRRLE